MKLFTKRDIDGALAKLAKAGLTTRQQAALEDKIIGDAIRAADKKLIDKGELRHHNTLAYFEGAERDLGIAVYWYHERRGHILK